LFIAVHSLKRDS